MAPGFYDSLELEEALEDETFRAISSDPGSLLDLPVKAMEELRLRFGRPPLERIGLLANERVRREVDGWTLDVDRILFPDGSESYELEIETDRAELARRWVDAEIRGRGLRLEPQRLTKLEQLLERGRP